MKFGIVFKKENSKAKGIAQKATEFLKSKGHNVLDEKSLKGADFILIFGGDGTLIHKACEYAQLEVPYVGINTGNLGFLTAVDQANWQEAIDKLIKKEYFVSERISVEASVAGGEEYRAINEIFVKGLYRAIELEVAVNGEKFLRVLGDGVIVASPTGSTAYSLSAGGPIVEPSLESLILTPINPIGLPMPSAVFSADDEIVIKVLKGDDISFVLDGQEHTKLAAGKSISVSVGKHKIKFVYFDKHQFVKSLNVKFGLSERLGS